MPGWRVSAEQQLSDMELQRVKEGTAAPPGTLENMKDAAYSILEQYLSEKVSWERGFYTMVSA